MRTWRVVRTYANGATVSLETVAETTVAAIRQTATDQQVIDCRKASTITDVRVNRVREGNTQGS